MQRLDYQSAAPQVMNALYAAGKVLEQSTLEPVLRCFVQIRASQINGCAFCLSLHWREAEALGERGDRISGLPAWREASWYTDRERAALEWTEAITAINTRHPDDALFQRVKAHFTDREMAELSLAIAAITSWNMMNVGFATPPEAAEAVFARIHPRAAAAG